MFKPFFRSIILLIFTSHTLFGQGVSNVIAKIDTQNPNVVNISYDLGGASGEKYKIEIFASRDNYQRALLRVSGDVGDNQTAGRGKLITWQAREELGFFTGEISFEIRSTTTSSQLRITTPTATSAFKPGASMPIRWTGGAADANLKLELYRSNARSRDIGTTQNTKSYSYTIPSNLPKGADYSVRMFDTSDANSMVSSPSFTIKSAGGGSGKKIAFIGLGVAAVGAGVALALGGGDDGGTTPPPATNGDSDPLPTPPDPSSGIMGKIASALITIRIGN